MKILVFRPPDVLLGSTNYSTALDIWGCGAIFAEMLSGLALFPGSNNVSDQLDRIFSIRGVPDEKEWPEVCDLPKYKQFEFPAYSELRWDQVDPQLANLPDNGCGLLSELLQVDFTVI
jgi:serine/threonine protein kinase